MQVRIRSIAQSAGGAIALTGGEKRLSAYAIVSSPEAADARQIRTDQV